MHMRLIFATVASWLITLVNFPKACYWVIGNFKRKFSRLLSKRRLIFFSVKNVHRGMDKQINGRTRKTFARD